MTLAERRALCHSWVCAQSTPSNCPHHPNAQLWSDRHREPHFSCFIIHANDSSTEYIKESCINLSVIFSWNEVQIVYI